MNQSERAREKTNAFQFLLTVLKFGKSPTAEPVSIGKGINDLKSSDGCIIRVGVRKNAGSVLAWHVLPVNEKVNRDKLINKVKHL